MAIKSPSPSRTYVIQTDIADFTKVRFFKFVLPETFENTIEWATWYFYNRLDSFSCGGSCITFEDYSNLKLIQLS